MEVWREDAREEGLEEGLAEGMVKGREERSVQIAKNTLAEGLSFEFTQKITGLDMETIKQLG